MQNNNELQDILLDKDDDLKNRKIKKILMSIAALSILFLIVIATTKILNSEDTPQNSDIDSRLILPPMPDDKQNEVAQIVKSDKKNDEQLFEQVPILPENKIQDDFEDMVKKLKDKEFGNAIIEGANKETTASQPVVKEIATAPIIKETKPKQDKILNEKPKAQKTETKKPEQKKPEVKSASSNKPKNPEIEAGSYIQVFATKSQPDQKELRKVSSKGYIYKILNVNGVNKVIVGPYSGSKLNSELSNIKKELNKDAFIYRVK